MRKKIIKFRKLQHKHPLAIRWFHWINFPMLGIMIWSGIMIYWANEVYSIHIGKFVLIKFFPAVFYHPGSAAHPLYTLDARLAEGMNWHFLFMWIFSINGLIYVLYTLISGAWRDIIPHKNALKESIHVVLYDLHLSHIPLPDRKYNAAQQIAYTGIIFMGLGSLITGLAIYKPVQLSLFTTICGGYAAARFEHFYLMLGFILFFIIHVGQVIKTGWNNFRGMITGYELVPNEDQT